MTDAITASAAVAAAVFSFVNVVVGNRFVRNSQDRQWRRETVRMTMSAFLEKTRQLDFAYDALANLRAEPAPVPPDLPSAAWTARLSDAIKEGEDAVAEVHQLLTEIELIATLACVKAAQSLFEALSEPLLTGVLVGLSDDPLALYHGSSKHIREARERYVRACRTDLGVGRRVRLSLLWY